MAETPASFVPPFCPNELCEFHHDSAGWRYKKKGFFYRKVNPRPIQRYRCSHCGRSFSPPTFSTTYWLKRRDLLQTLLFRIRACSGLRQIAQELGIAHSTLQRQVERLGRHCILFHERLRPRIPTEPLVLDGLRTLESGHYWPYDLNLVVGVSHYVYGFNESELRRSGTLRPEQRRHREKVEARYGRPDPQATRKAVTELVGRVVPEGASVQLRSDEHSAYPVALRALSDRQINHQRTSSKAARTPRNPLFPVNLADGLLRHGSANHKRETIAFSKRRQGAMYRAAIWTVWRNYLKSTSERRRSPPPAVEVGAIPSRLSVDAVLGKREFPSHAGLSGWLERCYFGRTPTRCLSANRSHTLRYAC